MRNSRLIVLSALLGSLLVLPAGAVEENCQDCHDAAPISADHMEVDAFTLEECSMCHAAEAGDELFEAIHTAHPSADVDCAECHGDSVTPDQKSKLQEILGG